MGMDIHTYIVDENGRIKYTDLYTGRNSEWFADLTEHAEHNMAYANWHPDYGLSKNFDPNTDPRYINCNSDEDVRSWCFDFRNIKVGEFIEWYEESKPYIEAGWCTKYEAWLYHNKGIVPDYLAKELSEYDIVADREFIEVNNPYDPATVIYKFLISHEDIDNDDYFNFFFDN